MQAFFLTGLTIGIIGSFHCIGMCGPLALSLPVSKAGNVFQQIAAIMAYNLGRVTTYFSLGSLFGAIGKSFVLVGYQQALSIATGLLLLGVLLFGKKLKMTIPVVAAFHKWIQGTLFRLLKKPQNAGVFFLTGLVNGLLPCGLVYLAIASAITTGTALNGGMVMAGFGLGTIPLMVVLMIAGTFISVTFRSKIRRLVPYFAGIVACVLILRGLNLGIPYISPVMPGSGEIQVVGCHPDSIMVNTVRQ
jgi:sulfite exporter TauE/SafE